MTAERKVVVVVPVDRLFNSKLKVHATRIRPLGLTAYGSTNEESQDKVKQMFGAYVRAHRKEGTLEARLADSGLSWCWADEYRGDLSVEWVTMSPDDNNAIWECDVDGSKSWRMTGELAYA